jgi:hypothetical protein
MKKCKRLSVIMLIVASFFMTGCDAEKIMEVINQVADGIKQAVPAVKEAIDTVSQVANEINNIQNGTAGNTAEQGNNAANVGINSAGGQEDLGGAAAGADTPAAAGSATAQQTAIGRAVRGLVGSTSFRGADVDGGNLACAQVVSTALVNAGAINRVSLNCDTVVSDLRAAGWQRVSVPPYQEGDVVTWTTSRGPGRHIGIIVQDGSSYSAISNSSLQITPRKHAINYLPVTQVLRKV